MGDGGVACMPLQHHNNNNIIMEERFPIQHDKTAPAPTPTPNTTTAPAPPPAANANANGTGTGKSNGLNSKTKKVMKKVIKVKKVVTVKKVVPADKKVAADKKIAAEKKVTAEKKESKGNTGKEIEDKEVESGGSGKELESAASGDTKVGALLGASNGKEEAEEGELGTLKWPTRVEVENGEFVPPEKSARRSEVEKGEIVGEKWRKGDAEKGEIISGGKWRKGEFCRDEIEKGEFIPDRWHCKDDYNSYGKPRARYDIGRDTSRECTPPLLKYPPDDAYRRKEFSRSGSSQLNKSSSRWELGLERNSRISSKIVDEEGLYKSEYTNGKNHGREFSSGNRLKRYGTEPDSSDRKHYGDYGDYAAPKSRRLSEDSARSAHSDHYSRHSMERFYRNSSSRISSLDKYSSRHHEPALSSKVVYDRHGRSPAPSERSPRDRSPYARDRSRHHDHRDRSPVRRDRSPYGRERSPYGRDRSPYVRERSPYVRERSPYVLERSPYGRERSPYDRNRHFDHRNRSPAYSERSPQDRSRHYERRDRTPNHQERSPPDHGKPNVSRETSRKTGGSEKRNSQQGNKGQEEKLSQRDSNAKDLQSSAKEAQDKSSVQDLNGLSEKNINCESQKEDHPQSPSITEKSSPQVDGPPPEELLSMEEDMDICDTPPHVPVLADSSTGKWVYLDYFGVECGPSKLCDLKALVEEGVLVSDHLIKHLDSDRWLTIENAVSPLVPVNFPSIVSDTITQLVSPPEAPGNILADNGDSGPSYSQTCEEAPLWQASVGHDDSVSTSDSLVDLRVDQRVETLMEGFTIVPGRELEKIGEALQMEFEHEPSEGWEKSPGLTWHQACISEQNDQSVDESSKYSEMKTKEAIESDATFLDSGDWFSCRWSCKGGDWKRDDEAAQDRFSRRKVVLNDGFPLCQMPKSGSEDPRWHRKDELYYPSQSRRLDLPPWAFSFPDERNEGGASRTPLAKPPVLRGNKGTVLPVVRINACVVTDHGSLVSEARSKARGKDRFSSRSARTYTLGSDVKRSSMEGDTLSKNDQGTRSSWKSIASINPPKDRLCAVDDLQLHLGEWYYLDGAGHERGPLSFPELQILADQGSIPKYSSVFRKFDRLWVPITSATETSEVTVKTPWVDVASLDDSSGTPSKSISVSNNEYITRSSAFHSLHPQFIGYTRGKLQELVMKSYKSREFAAAINEVLDPWINAKQPKKEIDKQIYRKSENDARSGKRVRMQVDESDDDYELEEDLQTVPKDETTFEQLCGDSVFHRKESACSEDEVGSWGLLDGHMLARVFHFLRSDLKSLAFASLTCKHWRAAVCFYKDISRQVDLSSMGPTCSDLVIRNIMNGYNKDNINSMVLVGCTKITSITLEEILCSFPHVSSIDIRGCSQLMELALQFPNVSWIKSRLRSEDSNSKMKNLKQISDKTLTLYKTSGLGNDADDFGDLKEYFDSVNKRGSANQLFRQSFYKRSKLFDARRSSSIVSRDARMRRWAIKKSENGYKRMQGFLASGLKDIMKENTFDFFAPKVAEIEDRMKSGYYIGHGLRSVKEDIGRMCRDAIKAKNRGGGDMNHIITLFLQLASRLDESSKFSYERDELMKAWKDDLSMAVGSASLKYRKKYVNERKHMSRSNGGSFANGIFDYGECVLDREIRKRLSKLNRKSLDSGSETSDDMDKSSDDGRSASSTTASDTESDLEFRSDGRNAESRGDGYFMAEEGFDSMTDEREWGARMTKASLVPPVTRKYEVIDEYVIVADEEDVRRKMSVSLPDDYAEKLDAQRAEELDMELPEVKDYKPRKQLGVEVIEQEVYGIDPYTHNLLLDSMPDEMDWPLLEKHLFIEDALLRTLNKQVRHYTGSGNTPMKYPLKPVVEELEQDAAKDCDIRTLKMCHGILKAINSRPDDNYVAYRKGLGVVCNKEGGFGEEDFVVEFLGEVYPAWKWFEKQDGIRVLQKDSNDPAPEFYNIYLERPKGDADGYDLVVVDAMHKANYASRICHSCRPNCEAKVTAVEGQYQIGIYTVRGIQYGEEITFDYNSVTESKEEYEASVCLCGSQVCRGSYLNLTGEGAFQKVLKEWHGMLDRHHLMLEACELNSVSEEDYLDLGRAGLASCLLGALPDWVVAYSARLVRFINLERTKLPEEILRHNLEEKRKYFSDICLEVERSDAEVQAEGVYNQRLQNLAVTLDKVRYVMRCVFGDAKKAPPPLEKLSPEETASFLWKGEGSLVEELLQSMAPHMEADTLNDLTSKINARDPSNSDDILKELHRSLLWLRDEVRTLPCTYKCRHDAAADLIHIYAYTKTFFRVRGYDSYTSPPVYISPLDLGPKYADKLGAGVHEYRKTYGENYCMGQLIFWHIQTNGEPDSSLAKASRGCLSLPDIGSFYAKVQKPSQQRIYGPKTVKTMLERMEKYPQKPWPKDQIWSFKSAPKVFGSPMLDAVLNNAPLHREMVHWLKHRPAVYQAMWDR